MYLSILENSLKNDNLATMNIKNLDWLECSLFLMLTSAEITDNYLTEEEITSIIIKAEGLVSAFTLDDVLYTHNEVLKKFNKVFEYYNYIGENAPEGKMNKMLVKEVFELTGHMKKQVWFSQNFAQTLINDLVAIADADGETIKNERQFINAIAKDWNLAQPLS